MIHLQGVINVHQKHQEAFSKLNAKQKEAVLHIDGPVLVLAGPGTGKTEVLAVRIGQILKQQDVYPSNILCLTYSNAAVEAMRKRLSTLIGSAADEIAIYTYHSLCNKLIQQNAEETFQGRSLITEAQRHMLIEKMIYDHLSPKDQNFLKPASAQRVNDLIRIFSTLKQEGITCEDLLRHAENCIRNILPLEEKYLKINGELNADGRKLRDRLEKFPQEISVMYDDYHHQLESRNKFEFEDMLIEGVLLLQSNPILATRLQEQYQYILVDEFQDTNIKQLALVDQLCSKVMEPNIFAVGDDDQCIYRFQGANQFNFEWMRKKFPALKTIVLDVNYRSTAVILQESFGLISKNNDRQPEKDSPLIAGNPNYENIQNKPSLKVYENAEQEAFSIAKMIHKSYNEQYNGIAILARKHKEFDIIKKWLGHFGIPFQTNRTWIDLLSTSFGKSFYHLLQFIRCHVENNRLAEGFLVQFLLHKGLGKELLHAYLKSKKDQGVSFFDWLNSNETQSKVLAEIAEKIKNVFTNRNEDTLIDRVKGCIKLAEFGIDSPTLEQEINALNEFITSFIATDRDKTMVSLSQMLWYHEQNGIAIKVEIGQTEEEEQNGVTLSTIHGSKGLQYDTVFLIGCQDTNWENRSSGEGIKIPDLLNRFIVPEPDSLDDMRRLVYVACTRAKTSLHISCYRKNYSGKELQLSTLMDGIKVSDNVYYEDVSSLEVPSTDGNKYQIAADEELMSLVHERLSSFEISPTSTGTWEICQNEFFFNAVMKLPGISAEAPSFGTLMHSVLQVISRNIERQHDSSFIEKVVAEEMEKMKLDFHPTRIWRYKQYGIWLIWNYLRKYPFQKTPDHIEDDFHHVLSNGAKLKGKLDRVEIMNDLVRVVDYKTGKYKKSLKPFESFEEPGTPYWRQANIYTLLMQENFREADRFNFEFHYPEHQYTVTPFEYEAKEGFEEWLGDIWANTQNLRFASKCAEPECVYCKNKLI